MSEKAKNLLIAAMLLSGMSGGEYMGMDWDDLYDWTAMEQTQEEQENGASNQADKKGHCDTEADAAAMGCGGKG